MVRLFYMVYQLVVAVPIILIATIITSLVTAIGCSIGDGHFWGYYPGKYWSRIVIRILLLNVKIEGREHLQTNHSYVFVANHQGAFDIFLIYGYLNRNFKWMMKSALRNIPMVGLACEKAHHIFVDKRSAATVKATYDHARSILNEGMSLVVFPEGARTFTGEVMPFRRGAFMLADELQLPVVPLTINGSFSIMPRTKDFHFIKRKTLQLIIHEPIYPTSRGRDNVSYLMDESYRVITKDVK